MRGVNDPLLRDAHVYNSDDDNSLQSTPPSSELISEVPLPVGPVDLQISENIFNKNPKNQQQNSLSYTNTGATSQSGRHQNQPQTAHMGTGNTPIVYGSVGSAQQQSQASNASAATHAYTQNSSANGATLTVSKRVTSLIVFGIFLSLFALCICLFLTVQDTNQSDKAKHDDIRCVIIPLIVYLINAIITTIFWFEARKFQMRGYSVFYQKSSRLATLSFRVTSVYFVIAFAIYAILIDDETKLDVYDYGRAWIFFSVWIVAYLFIILFLVSFATLVFNHNKRKPPPELFAIQPIESNPQFAASPSQSTRYASDQSKVVRQLYSDKKTLQKQLQNVSAQLMRSQKQLAAGGITSGPAYTGGGLAASPSLGISPALHNPTPGQLEEQNRLLQDKLRTERQAVRSLKAEIQTKQTMLDTKYNECEQQKGLIANLEQRIGNLQMERERLERTVNQGRDAKDDLEVLLQVKEDEINIAQTENERLRQELLMHIQGSNPPQQHMQRRGHR